MKIRHYIASDASALADIFNRAVTEIASGFYTPDQIAAWLGGGIEAGETDIRCSDGRTVWVAVDETGTAIAFIDLEDGGHIDMLFCAPEWSQRGIASVLYNVLEAAARDRGMALLSVEASEVALAFFTHKGFALLHRNDFAMSGTAIHNYAMEKQLDPSP